ncbi:MAG: C39 family peptidase [Candidatus Woesearchaeota archaeon]|jgi:hypothetical protein|nr:C39 family peptidase [Candidatus Woesearchaeota archaeon]
MRKILKNAGSENYYKQTNNPTEQQDKKKKISWLQSCGPTAVVNIIASIGKPVEIVTQGAYKPQPEEILNDYFHDPINYSKLNKIRPSTPAEEWQGNQIPQFYPIAIKDVFNIESHFSWGIAYSDIINSINKGKGLVVCLKSPGHFIAIVGYDSDNDTVIYNDPWPEDYWPKSLEGTKPYLREVPWDNLDINLQPYKITIG